QGTQRPQLASPTFTTAQPPPAAKTHHLRGHLLVIIVRYWGGERGHATRPCSSLLAADSRCIDHHRKRGDEHVDHHRATLAIIEHAGKKGCDALAIAIFADADHRRPRHPPPGEEFTAARPRTSSPTTEEKEGNAELPFAHLYRCQIFIIIIPHPHLLAHHHCRSLSEVPGDHDLPRPPSPAARPPLLPRLTISRATFLSSSFDSEGGERGHAAHPCSIATAADSRCVDHHRKRGGDTSITTEATLAIIEHAGRRGCDAPAIAIFATPTTADPRHPPPGEEFTARPTSHIIADNRGEGGQRRATLRPPLPMPEHHRGQ
ncbi:hypothetical protein Dimus_010266, partial [Dionaea muscipula]